MSSAAEIRRQRRLQKILASPEERLSKLTGQPVPEKKPLVKASTPMTDLSDSSEQNAPQLVPAGSRNSSPAEDPPMELLDRNARLPAEDPPIELLRMDEDPWDSVSRRRNNARGMDNIDPSDPAALLKMFQRFQGGEGGNNMNNLFGGQQGNAENMPPPPPPCPRPNLGTWLCLLFGITQAFLSTYFWDSDSPYSTVMLPVLGISFALALFNNETGQGQLGMIASLLSMFTKIQPKTLARSFQISSLVWSAMTRFYVLFFVFVWASVALKLFNSQEPGEEQEL